MPQKVHFRWKNLTISAANYKPNTHCSRLSYKEKRASKRFCINLKWCFLFGADLQCWSLYLVCGEHAAGNLSHLTSCSHILRLSNCSKNVCPIVWRIKGIDEICTLMIKSRVSETEKTNTKHEFADCAQKLIIDKSTIMECIAECTTNDYSISFGQLPSPMIFHFACWIPLRPEMTNDDYENSQVLSRYWRVAENFSHIFRSTNSFCGGKWQQQPMFI